MKVVHLPVYDDNKYQSLLMDAQRRLGWEVVDGGGGGNFLRSALYRWHADCIHFHWLHPYMTRKSLAGTISRSIRFWMELVLVRISGKRLVWTLHNLVSHDASYPRVEKWFVRRVVPLFDAIVCHSKHGANAARSELGASGGQVTIVPHGHYIGAYPQDVSRQQARERFTIAPNARVVLALGRIAAYKGLPDLIRAFQASTSADVLLIAGREAEVGAVSKLKALADNDPRIQIHVGFVVDDDLQYYFSAADLVVFPFRAISTSGSVVLAMSFGKMCLAPAIGGLPELLDSQQLYSANSETGLGDAIGRVDLSVSGSIGRQNRERANEWSWDTIAHRTATLYGVLTSPQPSALECGQ